ncbi:MAG: hypothetical protein HUU21_27090, partial [Polyangiaceae bacterium]|nr:hypothetical protein [Polyangiaceae bacterium]
AGQPLHELEAEDRVLLRLGCHDEAAAAQVGDLGRMALAPAVGEEVRRRLAAGFVASIGPVCSEALRAEGISPHLEPEHPKMGHLVKEAAARVGA